jgi:hypothetical protein
MVGVLVTVGMLSVGVPAVVVAAGEDGSEPAPGSSLPQPATARLRQLSSTAPVSLVADRMSSWLPGPGASGGVADDLEHD